MKRLLYGMVALWLLVGFISAQDVLFNVEDYEVLTPDNLSQLRWIADIGTGSGAGPSWLADNKTIFINTSTGQWRYDVTHLDEPPTFAPYPPLYSHDYDHFVHPRDEIDFKEIAISPDRQYVVEMVQEDSPDFYGSNESKGTLIVRERDSGKEIARLTSDAITGFRTITGLLTLPTFGALGLTYFRDDDLYRWSPKTKQESFMMSATQIAGGELVFSPDARFLATVRFGGMENSPTPVRFWNMTPTPATMLLEKEFPSYTTGAYANSLNADFAPDGKTLISSRSGQNVRIWDIASRGMIYQDTTEEMWDYETYKVAYSPDGRYIGGCQRMFGGGYAFLRDAVTGENVGIIDGFPGDGTYSCQDVFFHPTQPDFLVLNPFGTLESWPIADLIARKSVVIGEAPLIFGGGISEKQERPTVAALNGSGTVVALSYEDGLIHLMDYETGREIGTLENSSRVLSFVFNPAHDDFLISGDIEGDVKVWHLAAQTSQTLMNIPDIPAEYEENPWAFYANTDQLPLLMNAEGTLLAAYNRQHFWDTTANQILTGPAMPNAFSPDGRFMASIYNGDISLYGVPEKK
jgi:WD40 repeat protein